MEIAFAVGQTKQCDERVYSILLLLSLIIKHYFYCQGKKNKSETTTEQLNFYVATK